MVIVWVKVVEGAQETVTCPVVGFCTCMELVEVVIAATVPDAVENAGRGAVVVVVAAAAPTPSPSIMRGRATEAPISKTQLSALGAACIWMWTWHVGSASLGTRT